MSQTTSRRNALVKKAAEKFKGLVFTDPISLDTVGRSRGVMLNKQMYDARGLSKAITSGYSQVPHSRRPLTRAELAQIKARARSPHKPIPTTSLSNQGLPPLGRIKYSDVNRVSRQSAAGLVRKYFGQQQCWAAMLDKPGAPRQVLFNRYAYPGVRMRPDEERVKHHIRTNPGSLLDLVRDGATASVYMKRPGSTEHVRIRYVGTVYEFSVKND